MKSGLAVFWDIIRISRRFGGTYHLHLRSRRISQARKQKISPNYTKLQTIRLYSFMLVSCLAYSSTLRMVLFSFEMLGSLRTTRRYSPKDITLLFVSHDIRISFLNILKFSGYYMYHMLKRTKTLHSAQPVYLCVPYDSHNKQKLFPYTALTGWSS
jgi:hypothetical protein